MVPIRKQYRSVGFIRLAIFPLNSEICKNPFYLKHTDTIRVKAYPGLVLCILLVIASWIKHRGEGGTSGKNDSLLASGPQFSSAKESTGPAVLLQSKTVGSPIPLADPARSRNVYRAHTVSRKYNTCNNSAFASLLVLAAPAHHSWLSSHTFIANKYLPHFIPGYAQADLVFQRYTFVFSIFQRIFSRYIRINAP